MTNPLDPTRKPAFHNPYPSGDMQAPHRLNADVERFDINTIRSIIPDHGALQRAITMFVKALYTEINELNYTLADRELLIDSIRERCAPRLPARSLDRGEPDLHDGRRASGVRGKAPRATNVKRTRVGHETNKEE
jgi:hypothetical protein